MILKDEDVITRLESPLNLINQLNALVPKSNGLGLFTGRVTENEHVESPDFSSQLDGIVDEDKLRLGLVRLKALHVLHDSLNMLHVKLPEIRKPRDLSRVAQEMKGILSEDKGNVQHNSQVVIYKPIINDINKYDTLVVVE